MALTSTQQQDIIKYIVGLFNAAPGGYMAEMSQFVVDGGSPTQMALNLADGPVFKGLTFAYSDASTNEQFVDAFFANLLGDTVSGDALAWATDWALTRIGQADRATMMVEAIDTLALVEDENTDWVAARDQQAARVEAATEYTITNNGTSTDLDELQAVVAGSAPVETGDTITLTVHADSLAGDAGDNVFTAPVLQNETGSGELANTLETGDVLDGGAGADTLVAKLIATGTIQDSNNGAAISATTSSIEEVYLTAITPQIDAATNTTFASTIDAGSMAGVEQWWTDESRSDIRIEDIRTRPIETTFGLRLTDPNVSFDAYFNPLTMFGDSNSDSTLNILIGQLTGGEIDNTLELTNLSVTQLTFNLADETYTLSNDNMAAADTWADLEAAITEAMAENPALELLTVTHVGSGQFQIFDESGRTFSNQGGFAVTATTNELIDIRNAITTNIVTVEEQTQTTILLDGAGSGSQGGVVNIAAMSGDRGVEVFNVLVDNNSHITVLASENNPRNTASGFEMEQQLEEVYVAHEDGGAQGTLQIGSRTVDARGVSTTTDDRLTANGLTDVRVFDAAGFDAELKVGARLTANAFDKYLLNDADSVRLYRDGNADNPVQFSYTLGDAGSNLNLAVNNVLAGDPDFALDIIGGDGDDRINLTGLQFKASTTIDGETGSNTVEVDTTTGAVAGGNTAAENSWESFMNIQKLVVAGNNNTIQDLVVGNMAGLTDVIIATEAPAVNTELRKVDAEDQNVIVSGKNQTLGTGNNNNDQNFGIITLTDTTAAASAEMDLLLDNTARVDGVLTVANLVVAGANNDLTTLNLESAGVRDTSNVVADFDGADVTNLNLVGAQDLSIDVNTIAAGATVDVVVDGSALTGDLVLAVNGFELDGAADDELIGTDGENDVLALYNTVTTNTDVSEFETVQFGWLANSDLDDVFAAPRAAAGLYDAANTTGVESYIVGNVGANLTFGIDSLRSGNVVQLGDASVNPGAATQAIYTGATLDLTLTGAGATAQGDLTINALSELDDAQFATGEVTINVNNFTNVAMDFDRSDSVAAENLFFTAALDEDARTLTLTGGNADEDIAMTQEGELNTSLTRIDISDFEGEVNLGVWDSLKGSNATIVVNSYNFTFDVGGDNTVFAVPASAGILPVPGVAEQQTIDFTLAGPVTGAGNITVGGINIPFLGGELAPAIGAAVAAAINGQDIYGTGNVVAAVSDGAGLVTITAAVADGDVALPAYAGNAILTAAAGLTGDVVPYVAPILASADTAEVQTLDFTNGGAAGFGDLADGESITIAFAGSEYVFTNSTGADILNADIDNAIIADAANAPAGFTIATGGGDLIQLTATRAGDMPNAVVTASDAANVVAGNVPVAVTTAGDLVGTNVTGYDMVTVAPEFITSFDFNEDANDFGVVWQIDNFYAFEAGENVGLNNQSIIDLRDLGVNSATDIVVEDAATFWAGLTAAEQVAFNAVYDPTLVNDFGVIFGAADTVITSNEGLDFTIVLTGVAVADVVNENIAGIA